MRRALVCCTVLALCLPALWAADKPAKDTKKAAASREKLKKKISVDYDNSRLAEVVEDIQDKVPGLRFRLDTKGGVSQNQTFTYKAEDKTVAEVLDELFKKRDLGYIVISNPKDTYDGTVMIRKGDERGVPKEEK